MTDHGTPEGFRLHRRLESRPCAACAQAMRDLIDSIGQIREEAARSAVAQPVREPFTRVMLRKRAEAREAQQAVVAPSLPPVQIPATECVGTEPWMPRAPRSQLKAFRKAGWAARITRAAGPRIAANGTVPEGKEVVYTLAVAAVRGAERIAMVWMYDGAKWKLDIALHNRLGKITSTEVREIING